MGKIISKIYFPIILIMMFSILEDKNSCIKTSSFNPFSVIISNTYAGCTGQPVLSIPLGQTIYPGETISGISLTGTFSSYSQSLNISTCTSSNPDIAVTCNSFSGTSATVDLVATGGLISPSLISISIDDGSGNSSDTISFYVSPRFYASCKEIYDAGYTTDGTYSIDSDGTSQAAPYFVKCDMTNEGGGWTLVFNHDITTGGIFSDLNEAMENDASNVNSSKYSILYKLNDFKRSGQFEFRMNWPGVSSNNWWTQSSDPTQSAETRSGYAAVAVSFSGLSWVGIAMSSSSDVLIDGNNGSTFWYSVGVVNLYLGGLAGNGSVQTGVSLWVK